MRRERGAALVELAVTLPLLIVVFVGTADFARLFYMANELTSGARAGALLGSRAASTTAQITTAAQNGAANLTGVTFSVANPPYVCQCATSAGTTFTTVACTATCGTGTHMVTTVTVSATKTFTTLINLPPFPSSVTLTRTATLRLPN